MRGSLLALLTNVSKAPLSQSQHDLHDRALALPPARRGILFSRLRKACNRKIFIFFVIVVDLDNRIRRNPDEQSTHLGAS